MKNLLPQSVLCTLGCYWMLIRWHCTRQLRQSSHWHIQLTGCDVWCDVWILVGTCCNSSQIYSHVLSLNKWVLNSIPFIFWYSCNVSDIFFSWLSIQLRDSLLDLHKSIGLRDYNSESEEERNQYQWLIISRRTDMMCNIQPTFFEPVERMWPFWRQREEDGVQSESFSEKATPDLMDLQWVRVQKHTTTHLVHGPEANISLVGTIQGGKGYL